MNNLIEDIFRIRPGSEYLGSQLLDFYEEKFKHGNGDVHTFYEYSYFANKILGFFISTRYHKDFYKNISEPEDEYIEFNKNHFITEYLVLGGHLIRQRHLFSYNLSRDIQEYGFMWNTKSSPPHDILGAINYSFNYSKHSSKSIYPEVRTGWPHSIRTTAKKQNLIVYDFKDDSLNDKEESNTKVEKNSDSPLGFRVFNYGELFTSNKFKYDDKNEPIELVSFDSNGNLLERFVRNYKKDNYINSFEEISRYNKDEDLIEYWKFEDDKIIIRKEHYKYEKGLKSNTILTYGGFYGNKVLVEKNTFFQKKDYDENINDFKNNEYISYNRKGDPIELKNDYGIIEYKYKYNKNNHWIKRIAKYNYNNQVSYIITKRKINYFKNRLIIDALNPSVTFKPKISNRF